VPHISGSRASRSYRMHHDQLAEQSRNGKKGSIAQRQYSMKGSDKIMQKIIKDVPKEYFVMGMIVGGVFAIYGMVGVTLSHDPVNEFSTILGLTIILLNGIAGFT
jgi:hypothetical protein